MEEVHPQIQQSVLPNNFPNIPSPKDPWWKLPKSVLLIILVVFVFSVGSSAYLFFAPSSQTKLAIAPKLTPTPTLSDMHNVSEGIPTQTLEVLPTATPTPAAKQADVQSPTPTPNFTEGWNKYNNYEFKFTFLYPPGWRITDVGNFDAKTPSFLSINQTTDPATTNSITVSSSTRTYDEELALHALTRTPVTVNGLTGVKIEEQNTDGSTSTNVILKGGTYTYIMSGKKAYEATFNLLYQAFIPL